MEQAELDSLAGQLRSMQPRIEETVELERSLAAGGNALANVPVYQPAPGGGAPARRQPNPMERFRSWGDYAHALATPGEVQPEIWQAMAEMTLALELRQGDVYRTIVDVLTTDVPGLVPPSYITTIADTINASRPFIDAFSTAPLPDTGMVINYPTITQRPLVGKQTTQKTDVSSRKTTVTQANTSVLTYGGGEDVSVQVLQRTDPSYLSLMLQLYAEQMAIVMDTDAVAAAETAITTSAITLSAAAPAAWNKLLADAIAAMFQASRIFPDTFVMGSSLWGAFAGAASSDGRPLFPNVNAMNPMGQMSFTTPQGDVRGLRVAVDANMTASHGVLGNSLAFTTFVSGYQTMNVNNPTKLGVDYAVFEFAAFAARRPDAAIKILLGA
jgi:HK97 family phage major capsid protein